jgi:FG-GAP-like repeat
VRRILIGLAITLVASPVLAQTSLLPTLQQIRPEYPTPMSPAQLAEYLNRVAWIHRAEGWGLLKKTAGNRCPAPQGVDVACDILVYAPTSWHFDVIIDAGGASTPAWTDKGPCNPAVSGCDMARFLAPVAPLGSGNDKGTDFNGDLHPDLLWQNDATRQSTIWYMTGPSGNALKSASWVSMTGVPGWQVAATGDLNGDGKPDLVWVNDTTRQVTAWFMGGSDGSVLQSAAWLSQTGYPGWHIVGMDDFNADGKPDVVAQNDTTRQLMVVYLGGTQGTNVLGTNSLTTADVPGWSVVAVRDLNGDGKPDLVWQNDATRQVSVWYMGGAQGNLMQGAAWISSGGVPGWKIVGARDLNGDGKADLVWQNDATRQVSVWYMGGAQGNIFLSANWISSTGVPGWSVMVR